MINFIYIKAVFIILLSLKFIFETYLDIRQKQFIKNNSSTIPNYFTQIITISDHEKSAQYSLAKLNLGLILRIFEYFILISWTLLGGLNLLESLLIKFQLSPLFHGIVYILCFSLISLLISLPQTIYITFILEQRFGFNNTTVKIFILDLLKSLTMALILFTPILYILLYIIKNYPNSWWLTGWMLITGFQLLIAWIYPSIISPMFNKFRPLKNESLKIQIEKLLSNCGFSSKGVFIMDASKRSSHGNAYFTGLGKNKRIVFFDNLIKTITDGEILAILAHELGHFSKKHISKHIILSTLMSFLGFFLLNLLYQNKIFFNSHGINYASNHVALILFSLVLPIYLFFITPISSFFSRKKEFEADNYAVEKTNGDDLISSLIKLHKENSKFILTDPLYAFIYYSHPDITTRIENIKNHAP